MSNFYTAFGFLYDQVYVSGYENGEKFNRRVKFEPYLFLPDDEGEFKTVNGAPLKRRNFNSIGDARAFMKRFENAGHHDIYGMTNYPYVHIYENYHDLDSDYSLIRVLNIDIETDSQDGFGDIQLANREIISFTIKMFGEKDIYVVGRKTYETKEQELLDFIKQGYTIHYIEAGSERHLLRCLLRIWARLKPDIVTGWNIAMFDIPYIVKRIMQVLSEDDAKKLSPYGKVEKSEVLIWGKPVDKFEIVGIPIIDYMDAYKKFSFGNEETYKLEYIAGKILGAGKLDYGEYGSLARLWRENHDKFIDYNIIDVIRVEQLDDFLKFMSQIVMLGHYARCNFVDTFGTIRMWDVMIHNHLMDQGICVPQPGSNTKERQIAGGYVKVPIAGRYPYVMSYDLTSLYPHLFMMYNISPETLLGQFPAIAGEYSVDKILRGDMAKYYDKIREKNVTVSGKGTVFSRDKIGFLPFLMKDLFKQRKEYKRKMLDQEQILQQIKAEIATRGLK